MEPVVVETMVPENKGISWMNIALLVCVAIALGVASYILYTRYIKKKTNSTNGNKNTRAPKANTNINTNTNASATRDIGDDDFGANDFGDFDDTAPPPPTTR
jgi:hypothetical protein